MKPKRQNFTRDLSIACSTDTFRPVMNHVYFSNGYAYASDSHILIKQSLEYHTIEGKEHLEGRFIHKNTFKAIYKYPCAEAKEEGIECTDKFGNKVLFRYNNLGDSKFPNAEGLFNKFKPNESNKKGFDLTFLDKVRKIFGDRILIEFGEYEMNRITTNEENQVCLIASIFLN